MNKYISTLLSLIYVALLAAQDSELTNYKSGIDVIWGGTKGTAYQEEYWYHDKLAWDTKQVWIRDNTSITMSHNAMNMASLNNQRPKTVVGASGGGQIRYKIDKIWQELLWAPNWDGGGTTYPAYTAPFTLASQNYESGVAVVGTTGWYSGGSYWRGMVDSVGDEWHVFSYADDDSALGGFDDSWASDGKWVLLVVNPKTPCLTARVTGDGQFYTTPAWTYWTHKIHDQTTYFQAGTGTVTFELRDIYGNDVHYRINGGSWVDAGSSTVTLDDGDFSNGSNTLEYYYEGNESYVRTRTLVKNPTHPGAAESHGNRIWGGSSAWTAFQSRATRAPYSSVVAEEQDPAENGQNYWDTYGRLGWRYGQSNWPIKSVSGGGNAIMAKYLGFTAVASGKSKSYAQYAKEMLLDSFLNQSIVGWEQSYWASMSIPAADTVYRGYWDVNPVYSSAIAYDVLMDGYRSDQQTGGITPVEDYFIRDQLASWVHQSALQIGGFAEGYVGMWGTCRNVGATMVTVAMPNYSTSYYGTSGMDSNTDVYTWAPFQTYNYTWKDMFVDHDNSLHTFQEGPKQIFGMEGSVASGALIRPPETAAVWVDKTSYASWGQCGHNIGIYANMMDLYSDINNHPYLLNFLDQITEGTLYGGKTPPTGTARMHMIYCQNARFPTAAANATAWIQGLPGSDGNSEANALADGGLLAVFWYDDTYYGGSVSPPSVPSGLAYSNVTASTVDLDWNASTGTVSGYKVYINGSNAVSTSSTNITLTGLSPSTSYTFTVSAYNNSSESGQSSGVNATTTADTTAPSVPGGLAASNVTNTTADLDWNASTDNVAVTGYKVYTNGSNPASVSGTSVTMSGLSASTSYTFTVSAVDAAANESSQSSGVNVTTQSSADTTAPSTPTGLAYSNVTASSVDLDWNASTDNVAVTGYRIYRDSTEIDTTTSTSYTDTGLSASTSYSYTVTAYDAASNESSASSAVNVTTSSGGGGSFSVTIEAEGADREIWNTGDGKFVSQANIRLGGVGVNTDSAGVFPFELPVLESGESITAASFTVKLESINNTPGGVVDLYGLGYRTSSTVTLGTDFYQGTYDGDSTDATALQSSFTTLSSSTGTLMTTNSTGDDNLVDYINAQYAAGAQGGDYVFLRINPSIGDVSNYEYWVFSSANAATATDRPTLYLDISGGGDSEAPSTPTGLAAGAVTTTTVALSWNASTDNVAVAGYKVYTNGANPVSVAGTSTTVAGLTQNTAYTFTVTAVDAATNESSASSGVNVTTADGEAPSTPTGLVSSNVTSTTVDLDWNASTDNVAVTGYKIYIDGSTPVSVVTTSVTIASLEASTEYDFTVSAVDAEGNESTQSSAETVTTSDILGSYTVEIETESADREIWNTGDGKFISQANIRLGGVGVNTDSAGVFPFELPVLESGESITAASFTVKLESINNTPGGVVDLYGLGYRASSTVTLGTDFYQGTYDGDSTDATALQSSFATLSSSTGTILSTDSTGDSNLVDYINAQYTAGAEGGDYAFLRINPSISDVSNYQYWVFSSGDATTAIDRPTLILEISGGADTTAPSMPTGLASSNVTPTSVNLSWNASTDNVAVTGYKVYTGGTDPIAVTGTSTTITGLTQNTGYTFTVTAMDAMANESSASSGVNVTTADGVAPSAPTSLSFSNITASSVDLSWNASSDNVGVTGYRIYRDSTAIDTTTSTNYSDSGLSASTTYSYTVTAYDATGNESNESNVVNVATSSSGGGSYSVAIEAESADREIWNTGDGKFITQANIRLGGVGVNTDSAGIFPFELPELESGESITAASFTVKLESINNAPGGVVDLYGLGYRTSSTVTLGTDFYQGTYDGDSTDATALQSSFATLSSSTGTILSTSSTGEDNLIDYLNAQYTAGAEGGDYVFLRINPSISDVSNYQYWVFSSADATTAADRPILTLEISGGADTTAPSTPTGLTASNITSSSVDLDWNASTDNVAVTGYKVYIDGSDPVTVTGTSVTITGLDYDTEYDLTVTAIDAASNESSASSAATVTTAPLISEDFSSDADNFAVAAGAGTWSVSGGRYLLTSPTTVTPTGVLGNISAHNTTVPNDFDLTVTLRITGTTSAWNDAAIVFGFQDEDNYYYASLNESNDSYTKGIIMVEDGQPTQLADITITVTADTDYDIEIIRAGSSIVVKVDDTQVASATNATFGSGKVGVGTFNDGAQFDDLIVR